MKYSDGTFKSYSKLYHQIFAGHCIVINQYPLVNISLPSKNTQCYLKIFQNVVSYKECKK